MRDTQFRFAQSSDGVSRIIPFGDNARYEILWIEDKIYFARIIKIGGIHWRCRIDKTSPTEMFNGTKRGFGFKISFRSIPEGDIKLRCLIEHQFFFLLNDRAVARYSKLAIARLSISYV
jgi:hypothetical protein